MLIFDMNVIGNKLYKVRKAKGYTQAEVAEKAELSDRTYADIERGDTTMRIDTLLKICLALHISPNDILVTENDTPINENDIINAVENCTATEKRTALKLLNVYLESLK